MRHLYRISALVLVLALGGCGGKRPPEPPTEPVEECVSRQVWFTPNLGTVDMLDLWRKPEDWPQARSKVNVLEFHQVNVLGGINELCDECGPNTYQALASAGAFNPGPWALSIQVATVKDWDCEGTANTARALTALSNIRSAGGTTTYLTMDEPLWSGRKCGQSLPRTAVLVATFIREVHAKFPDVAIGLVEPYPYFSRQELTEWLQALSDAGVVLPFFHLDVDRSAPLRKSDNLLRDMRSLHNYCASKKLAFGVMYTSHNRYTDSAYYDDVLAWSRQVKAAVGIPCNAVFISWTMNPDGSRTVPRNLPETGPYTHTRIVGDILRSATGESIRKKEKE